MTYADFCLPATTVSGRRADRFAVGFGGDSALFNAGLNPTPVAEAVGSGGLSAPFDTALSPAPVALTNPQRRQISPDKNVNFPRTTAPFTLSRGSLGFSILCWVAPGTRPRTTFLFVGSRVCYPSDPASRRRPCPSLVVIDDFTSSILPQGTRTP